MIKNGIIRRHWHSWLNSDLSIQSNYMHFIYLLQNLKQNNNKIIILQENIKSYLDHPKVEMSWLSRLESVVVRPSASVS